MRRVCSLSGAASQLRVGAQAGTGLVRAMASFAPLDTFVRRHVGPRDEEVPAMLKVIGFETLDDLCNAVVPQEIRFPEPRTFNGLPQQGLGETDALELLQSMAEMNEYQVKSYLGQGFHGTITPPVILRNILQNPGWYTAYTPYQAEISQGRMEMLLNYQTMVCDLTGMAMSNASLLDEGSAAAEALSMCHALHKETISAYFVDEDVHPTTLAVVTSRADPLRIKIYRGDAATFDFKENPVSGALLQYPGSSGNVRTDLADCIARVHEGGARAVVATDLLALTLLTPPGQLGADACVGSSQRFGVPMGCGGPHAAFLAVKDATIARRMPGRIMAVSKDREHGLPAIRMALQTREQHIRRDKATSNICTAQALLANMAAAYAVYHGPVGLRAIAGRVHGLAEGMRHALRALGTANVTVHYQCVFDTVTYTLAGNRTARKHVQLMEQAGFNVRPLDLRTVAISLDETTSV